MMDIAAVTPGSWVWIVIGLATAVMYMGVHFKHRHEQDRQDRKEEREALLTITREMGQIVKDNTATNARLASMVERMEHKFDMYTRQEH